MAKRRQRVVWLPNTNANSLGPQATSTTQTFVVGAVGAAGDFAVGEIPIVIDSNQDPIGAEDVSLSDIFNSGYLLKRVVGKVFLSARQAENGGPPKAIVHAGFIIRRAEDLGTSYAFATGDANLVTPGGISNSSDPWIWRRAWVLSNNDSTVTPTFWTEVQTNNVFAPAGSLDGPHVDVKTGRRVGPEERLFFSLSVTILQAGEDQSAFDVLCAVDVRCLATLSTSVGNRRNASR